MKRTILTVALAAIAVVTTASVGTSAKSKVAVCHVPPGNVSAAHVINIDDKAVNAHVFDPSHCGTLNGTTYCDYVVGVAPGEPGGPAVDPQTEGAVFAACDLQQ